jgi:putative spermidine/putrescine transport system ATP-binding protein
MTANTAKGAAAGPAGPTGAAGAADGPGAQVSLRDLSRFFGSIRALDGLNLEIEPGELVALLGPSGCGKTTALRILAGFESADRGSVLVDGRDMSAVPAARRDMGMVFQSYSLFPNMSALDNVAFGLRMRKKSAARRRSQATELLDMVGLAGQARQFPHQLSGGQQQRVALARALAIEPRVLLLDEPLSALDAKVRVQLREQIRSLQQRLHTTTLFVTHDQEEALSMADRVGVMRDGRLEQVAAPSQLYARPATAFVAEFVGTMNRIPGELAGDGRVHVLGSTLPTKGGQPGGAAGAGGPGGTGGASGPGRASRPGPVDVLVRPEDLRLTATPAGSGIVTIATFLGSLTRVSVLLSQDVTVQVDVPSTEAPAPGAPVEVKMTDAPVLVTERR